MVICRNACFNRLLVFLCGCLLLCGLNACGGGETEKPKPPRVVTEDEAGPWADSLVRTLPAADKAGQLFAVALNKEDELENLLGLLKNKKAGAVIIGPGLHANASTLIPKLQEASPFPLWVGFEINAEWCAKQNFPDFLSLGACTNDSTAWEWGQIAAAWARLKGFNFIFISAARTHETDGVKYAGALGTDPVRTAAMATSLHRGLAEGGIFVCEQPLPADSDLVVPRGEKIPVLRRNVRNVAEKELKTFSLLRDTFETAVQCPNIRLTSADAKMPMAFSTKVLRPLFRDSLRYEGILFSPPLNDSVLEGIFTGSRAVAAFSAGCEFLIHPTDAEAESQELANAFDTNAVKRDWMNRTLKKILVARARTVREVNAMGVPEKPVFDYQLELLRRKVFAGSLSLLANRSSLVPLGPVETEKVATLAIGMSSQTPFQAAVETYVPSTHLLISATATGAQLNQMLAQLNKYKFVLAAVYAPANGDFLTPEMVKFLGELQKQNQCVTVHFGASAHLRGLELQRTLLHCPVTTAASQEFAAQALLGAMPLNGKLQEDATQHFCSGQGIRSLTTWRLRYNALPEEAGIDSRQLYKIDSLVNFAIRERVFPGCQIFVAKDSKVIYHKAFGHHDYDKSQRVLRTDLYDVASVTKMAATTLAVMSTFDKDSLKLEKTLKDYIPGFDTFKLKDVVIEDILIHKAGLPPALPVYYFYTVLDSVDSIRSIYYSKVRDEEHTLQVSEDLFFHKNGLDTILNRVSKVKSYGRGNYEYSDLGFFLMKTLVEKINKTRLDSLVEQTFYKPLGLRRITFNPLKKFSKEEIPPTEQDKWFRRQLVHGYVHDQAAALLGGISGHAGLFSDAHDLGVLMQMLVNRGLYAGRRFFKEKTVDLFTARHRECYRGLGFDHQTPAQDYAMVCSQASADCFGHTGFTGTCAWADPENGLVYIFLSNRVHPDAKNSKINQYGIRQAIQQVIYEAIRAVNPRVVFRSGESSLLSEGDSLRKENDTLLP